MKKLLLIPLAMMLVACPRPRYVDVYNNSGQSIFVYGPYVTTEIRPERSKSIRYQHFVHHQWSENPENRIFVWMKVGYKLREYQIALNTWWALGPHQDFTDHIQVEANGDVLYLEGAGPRPALPNTPQPDGFPLHGSVPDWLEKK
jgi:hypothetical protein